MNTNANVEKYVPTPPMPTKTNNTTNVPEKYVTSTTLPLLPNLSVHLLDINPQRLIFYFGSYTGLCMELE